jgi:hypothetical protein
MKPAKRKSGDVPTADVDKKTATGKGDGGFSPHPEQDGDDKPAPYNAAYRANVEPPPVKPVGKTKP